MEEKTSNSGKKEKKKMGYGKKCLVTLLAALLIGVVVGGIHIYFKYGFKDKHVSIFDSDVKDELGENDSDKEKISLASADETNNDSNDEIPLELTPVTSSDVSTIVANAMPSVVSIRCKVISSGYYYGYGNRNRESVASGTGFIIGQNNEEILIATNNHVVDEAKSITVNFIDNTEAEATVKGVDSYYDLAVIAVDIKNVDAKTINKIKIATLGSSDNVEVGSMAIAIGNSLGYGQSTTVGYISAIDRNVKIDNFEMELIQTDTAINPGNSGGPLLNINGEVIGINSSKKTGTAVESMGYCIPISKAIPVINELMNRVELSDSEMGYLGIKGKDISSDYATSFKMPVGVYVSEVEEGSPADLAGIHVGDVITSINGRKIASMDELRSVISYVKAGNEISVTVSTNIEGKYVARDISVKLVNRPTEQN